VEGTTLGSVRSHFDREAREGRRLLPDRETVRGLGTYVKYEKAVALMAEPAVHSALDIGCNRGSIEFLFHQTSPRAAANVTIHGVDIAAEAITQAQELELPGCQFQVYDGSHLPFPDHTFDLAIMVEVLEHVMDKSTLLGEINRVLRPGGRFYITVPNPQSWALNIESALWRIARSVFQKKQPAKDVFVDHASLIRLLQNAGFAVSDQERLYSWPHAYLALEDWSVIPPFPPRLLYRYQLWCTAMAARNKLPLFLDRGLHWTLAGLVEKRA
jgi:ubiquinone/menaquinone biosynthesis C-methylase UbiE